MNSKTDPSIEQLRLEDLIAYDILDTENEGPFNDLMELAAMICGCEIAAISFLDRDRQWFKARMNFPFTQTPRSVSFCTHTILGGEVMIIEDAKKDSRFSSSPLVNNEPNIGFYAGAPIISSAGFNLGSVCVMANTPRPTLSDVQVNGLEKIARQVTHLLELKVRNKLILQQAESLVEVEKNITRLAITEQESERKYIARELHENFAQTLAAVKLYIEFAEQSKDTSGHFIKKSKDNLVQIIKELRNLSNSMVPTTLEEELEEISK